MDEIWPYLLHRGEVIYSSSVHTLNICKETDLLAVMYDVEGGVLHKHGAASRVRQAHARVASAFVAQGFDELAQSLEIVEFPVTPETIEELNACIAISGRVLGIKERLGEIGARQNLSSRL